MNTSKIISSLLLITILALTPAIAQEATQTEVSDQDLKKFAAVLQEIQAVNQQAQQDMVVVVEDEGLEIKRFNEIRQAQANPDMEVDVSEDEVKMFNAATEELVKIQEDAQKDMETEIKEEGLTVAQYQNIATQIQNNPELQQKLQQYLEQG